jgi:hypothetical protein
MYRINDECMVPDRSLQQKELECRWIHNLSSSDDCLRKGMDTKIQLAAIAFRYLPSGLDARKVIAHHDKPCLRHQMERKIEQSR